jgi:peptide/nickel transport system substrate-binding protein
VQVFGEEREIEGADARDHGNAVDVLGDWFAQPLTRRTFVAAALAAALAREGTFARAARATTSRAVRDIVFLDDTDVDQLHPHDFKTLGAYRVQDALYDRLIDWRPYFSAAQPGRYVFNPRRYYSSEASRPMLLERFSLSPEQTVFRGVLRRGMRFQSGNPITTESVRWNFEAMLKGDTVSPTWLHLLRITDERQVRVVDERTFEIHLQGPNPLFWPLFSNDNNAIVDDVVARRHATKDDPYADRWVKRHAAGSGPYRLAAWAPGQDTVLVRRRGYWREGAVKNDRIVVKSIPDASQRALLMRGGAADLAQGILPRDLAEIAQNDQDLRVISVPIPNAVWMGMNWNAPPFDDVQVRKAMLYVIPYAKLIKTVWHGYAAPMTSVIPSGMPGHTDKYWPYVHDLKTAKRLLDASGVRTPVEVEFAVDITQFFHEPTARLIQGEAAKIGINIRMQRMRGAEFQAKLYRKQHQLFMYSWHSFANDPFYNFRWLFNASKACCSVDNFPDPYVERMTAKWIYSTDSSGRLKAAEEVQRHLNVGKAAWGCLFQPNFTIVIRKSTTGWAYYGDDLTRYAELGKV